MAKVLAIVAQIVDLYSSPFRAMDILSLLRESLRGTTQIYAKIVQEKLSIDMQSLRGKLSTSIPKAVESATKSEAPEENATAAA